MNTSNDGIVVYRSEGERAFDQWIWSGGGGTILLIIVIAILLAVILVGLISAICKKRY